MFVRRSDFLVLTRGLPTQTMARLCGRALAMAALLAVTAGCARHSDTIPMTKAYWDAASADAVFAKSQDAPDGELDLKHGSADLKNVSFSNGTIEFDIGLVGHGILGVKFRARDKDNADVLYFRPQPNCATSDDCIQYMPLEHGAFEWDLFPQYQAAAPINSNGWNHIRMVIAGKRMKVFVNGQASPSLAVDDLEGPASIGTIGVHGPANFRNFKVTPAASAPSDVATPPAADFIRNWQVSDPVRQSTAMDAVLKASVGTTPAYASMPPASARWKSIQAEPQGLVDLSREVGSQKDGAAISLAWLTTTLVSDRDQVKTVHIGFVREIWVYSNGKPVYQDRNLYGVPGASKAPDGRFSIGNGSFSLPLHKGRNQIAVAVDDNLPDNAQHYGWGFAMRLDDPAGVSPSSGAVSVK